MGLGLRLTENVKVNINENREKLIEMLKNEEIRHKIMYDKENEQGDLETIMSISEFDMEISFINNTIDYIRSYNNDNTSILKREEEASPAEFIKLVHTKVRSIADDIMNLRVEIERLDMNTMKSAFIVTQEKDKVRISLSKDGHGNVFMNTFKRLKIHEDENE